MRFSPEHTVPALGKAVMGALAAGLLAAYPVRGWADMGVSHPAASPNFHSAVAWESPGGTTGKSTAGTNGGTTGGSAGDTTGGTVGGTAGESNRTVPAEQASWNVTPTLAGGARASISGIDPNLGVAFAFDGYYTP